MGVLVAVALGVGLAVAVGVATAVEVGVVAGGAAPANSYAPMSQMAEPFPSPSWGRTMPR